MSEWLPIETAPKDGAQVLVSWVRMKTGDRACSCVRWEDEDWVSGKTSDGTCIVIRQPTHWMPLPSPPKAE